MQQLAATYMCIYITRTNIFQEGYTYRMTSVCEHLFFETRLAGTVFPVDL